MTSIGEENLLEDEDEEAEGAAGAAGAAVVCEPVAEAEAGGGRGAGQLRYMLLHRSTSGGIAATDEATHSLWNKIQLPRKCPNASTSCAQTWERSAFARMRRKPRATAFPSR